MWQVINALEVDSWDVLFQGRAVAYDCVDLDEVADLIERDPDHDPDAAEYEVIHGLDRMVLRSLDEVRTAA